MRRLLLLVALLVAACGDNVRPSSSVLTDTNSAVGIVEVEIVATPAQVALLDGKPADVWAYRDGAYDEAEPMIPGPMLEANQGDRVIVHFRNELPDETTIHWHGIRVPNAADGTPVSQVPVPAGGTFDYEFTAGDTGLFWYHPHMNGDVQVERGLYAPVLVHGGVEPDVVADRVFVLDDVKIEADGQLSTNTDSLDVMMGRQGNVLLVNGKQAGATLDAPANARERWRFVNAANGRYFNLELPGRSFLVIGWDDGLLVQPYMTQTLLVAPGERYDVLVDLAGAPGDALTLRTLHYDRGHDLPDPGPKDLITFELGASGPSPAPLPDTWGSVDALPFTGAPIRNLVLSENDTGAEPVFMINGQAYPNITPVSATEGAVEIWVIHNMSPMDHPFHLHGMSFQVLNASGTAVQRLGWKDTVNVPSMTMKRLAVRFDAVGRWMYHCHILEHAERGMVGELEVSAP